jgi:transcriptional regulator with XRE-family HTH domain
MNKSTVNPQSDYSFVTPNHIRAARAWLGWNLREIEEKSGLALDTVSRYERGARKVLPETVAILARTFEREGVVLAPDGIRVRGATLGQIKPLAERHVL